MASSNSKILALQYYDSLIRQVDIHAEELLEKFGENQLLEQYSSSPIVADSSELNCLIEPYRIRLKIFEESYGVNSYHDPYIDEYRYKSDSVVSTSSAASANDESTVKVCDYVNRIREELIFELKSLQSETLSRCDVIRSELDAVDRNSPDCLEKLKMKIFSQKFAFIQRIDEIMVSTSSSKKFIPNPTPFKLYLFVVDDLYLDSGALVFLK